MIKVPIARLASLALASFFLSVWPAGAAPNLVSGTEQWENVNYLKKEIQWYDNLRQAQDAARQKGKMVFYMHILGKLDGAT